MTNPSRRAKKIPAVSPGEFLSEEYLKPLGMNMNQLALALRVPGNRISQIVEGRRSISADTALRLGRYFGTGPEFWLALQTQYDLECARDELEARIDREVSPRPKAA